MKAVVRRQRTLVVFMLVTFAVLVGQLGNLSLRNGGTYVARAEAQRLRTLPVPGPRGSILDRNMTPLAITRPAHRVIVHFPYYSDPGVVQVLSEILQVAASDIEQLVKWQKDRPFEPLTLKDDLSPREHAQILERKHELPGVEIQAHPLRHYPERGLAAHVLGYVGEPSQEEVEKTESEGAFGGDQVGRTGLEAFYDTYLRGKSGLQQVVVNNSFEPLGVVDSTAPVLGHNLVLTLDARLQKAAERALDWQMHRLQTIPHPGDGRAYPEARAGAAVVMDVRTGAVLAMASRPAFEPNLFVGGISARDWEGWANDPLQPLLNRATQAAYHPGSTWKMLTGAAALADGVTTESERVFSGARYEPTEQTDWMPGGHGWVNLADALRVSSDIYFYEMGRRLGIDRQVAFAQRFGFGQRTGIDLHEGVAGFVPDQAFREKRGWYLGDTTSAAIGQIFTVTPLQLARYTAALANGGKMMAPYLVQRIEDAGGKVVREFSPRQVGTLPVPETALSTVIDGMKRVTLPGGTSDFALWPLPGITTAGKTGTAENPPHDDYGLYVGFAPAEDPQIAVAVVIEQAGHGSSVSPVARTIFAEYFGVQLPADDPARVPAELGAE